jgi:hypothetical protein
MESPNNGKFPAIRFLLRFGGGLAWVLAGIPVLAGLIAAFVGLPRWVVLVGILMSPILLLFVRSYVEMVQIIADTLLPR